MLRTYAAGLVAGLVLALSVAGVYIATEPKQEAGLLWGGIVYDSKQEFNGYLKSKGLSYKVWLQRNPGVAPWEPNVQASPKPSTGPSAPRLPLAVLGLVLAIGCALLLVLRPARPVLARVPTTIGALPSRRPLADRLGKGLPAGASLRRLGVLASSAVRSVEAAVSRYSGRPGGGRAPEARLLPGFPSERTLRLRSFANSGVVSRRLESRRRRAPVWLPHPSLRPAVGTAAPDVVGGLLRAASTAAPRATAAGRDPQAASSRVTRESEVELPAAKPDHTRAPDKQAKTDTGADAELLKRKPPPAATDPLRVKANEEERTKAFTSVKEAMLKEKLVSIPVQKQASDPSERALPARPRTRRTQRESALLPVSAQVVVQTPDDVLDATAATSTRECEIHSWRGYVMSEFFAVEVNPDGSRATIAASPAFRWPKRDASRRTPEAAAALQELVTTLEGDGWIVAEDGEEWFGLRLRTPESAEHADTAGRDRSSTAEGVSD